MTTENNEVTEDQLQDEGFEAGFNEARGEEPPAEPVQEAATEEVVPTAEETPAEEPKPVLAGLTEDQIKNVLALAARVPDLEARLEQQTQKLHGKFGELNRTMQELNAAKSSGDQADIKSAGAKLTKLRNEFPELADLIEEDLAGIQPTVQGVAPEMVEQLVEQRAEGISKRLEEKFLSHAHPDWKEVVNSDGFNVWLKTKPAEFQQEFGSTWDSIFLAQAFGEFKTSQQQKAPEENKQRSKDRRLEAALTPQGERSPMPAPDENAAFLEGFKAIRGR